MADAIYVLCAVMSLACAVLLARGYRASRTRLLFWSSLCFTGLALNNLLLVFDSVVVPEQDLSLLRSGVALAALSVLSFGLIWESK